METLVVSFVYKQGSWSIFYSLFASFVLEFFIVSFFLYMRMKEMSEIDINEQTSVSLTFLFQYGRYRLVLLESKTYQRTIWSTRLTHFSCSDICIKSIICISNTCQFLDACRMKAGESTWILLYQQYCLLFFLLVVFFSRFLFTLFF